MQRCIGLLAILLLTPTSVTAEEVRLDRIEAESQLAQIELAISAGRATQAGSMLQWLEGRLPEALQARRMLLLAEMHMAAGDSNAAQQALEKVPSDESDHCRYGGVAGWLAYQKSDWNLAITMLAKSVEACPEDPGRWNLLGLALVRKSETSAALEAFNQALVLAPNNPSLLNNRALAYAYAGKTGAALADLERAAAIGNDLGITANLAALRANAGLEAPLEATQDPQTQTVILANAGDGARAADRNEAARAYYAQAILQSERFDSELWTRANFPESKIQAVSKNRNTTP
ncbi:tetratricopeptide repeat protein [Sphingorhabdus sp.]|jgi:Flp pilus assembly protein TadD|uniref:tetratricopeptide repeat protein n=1 Tax=Sphingorhabdus sp. TaxID=1902408 RepID=UPI002B509CBF|nr:tetratricopeptide repeat protein [Sphingorhabdus sp.]HMT41003.1 tetratricopeptide repeat protein [Sphingorhabdus sp.]